MNLVVKFNEIDEFLEELRKAHENPDGNQVWRNIVRVVAAWKRTEQFERSLSIEVSYVMTNDTGVPPNAEPYVPGELVKLTHFYGYVHDPLGDTTVDKASQEVIDQAKKADEELRVRLREMNLDVRGGAYEVGDV